jgi:hypothetical protein
MPGVLAHQTRHLLLLINLQTVVILASAVVALLKERDLRLFGEPAPSSWLLPSAPRAGAASVRPVPRSFSIPAACPAPPVRADPLDWAEPKPSGQVIVAEEICDTTGEDVDTKSGIMTDTRLCEVCYPALNMY